MIAEHVARWTGHQRQQYRLCELLDRLADSLPLFEMGKLDDAAASLRQTLLDAHDYEEQQLFPMLEVMSSQIAGPLSMFRSHHAADRLEADRIAWLVDELVRGSASPATAELTVRIPLFVTSLRRHVQFEETICKALFASSRISSADFQSTRRIAS